MNVRDSRLIVEGLVTTMNADRSINISPMGPEVDRDVTGLCLKPYRSSRTYQNLKRQGEGVFHVTDDVEMIARSSIGLLRPPPPMFAAPNIDGQIIADTCRWYAFRVEQLDDHDERTRIECQVVAMGRVRDFLGFNRAKHAVLEAAILATRLDRLPRDDVQRRLEDLAPWVEKTGGGQERQAFDFLRAHVCDYYDQRSPSPRPTTRADKLST